MISFMFKHKLPEKMSGNYSNHLKKIVLFNIAYLTQYLNIIFHKSTGLPALRPVFLQYHQIYRQIR